MYFLFRSEKRVTIKRPDTTSESAISETSDAQSKSLRRELIEKTQRLESILAEKNQLQNRVKVLEERSFDGNNKNLEQISRLTGKVDHLTTELKIAEERAVATNNQLETQTILCKDREKQVHHLQEEVSYH